MPVLAILAGATVMIVAFLCAVAKLTLAPSALPPLLLLGTGWSLGAIGVQPGALDVFRSPVARKNTVYFRFVFVVFLLILGKPKQPCGQ